MNFTKFSAALLAVSTATALAACSSDEEEQPAEETTAAESSASADQAAPELPTAADLNGILAKATDPNVPIEEKTGTVQGGETAPELFDTMAQSQAESGAVFEVVDPILPGPAPDSALATVNFSTPEGQDQTADSVEFVNEDGNWKLSQAWACTLITNIVPPEEVPEMCGDASGDPAAGDAADPAAEQAPADAPVEAPAQ